MTQPETTDAEARSFAWEAMRQAAARSQKRTDTTTQALSYSADDVDSIEGRTRNIAKANGKPVPPPGTAGWPRRAAWSAFLEAFRLGLVEPCHELRPYPHSGQRYTTLTGFRFTTAGLQHYAVEVPLWDSSQLSAYLCSLGPVVSATQAALLLEAQRCWRASCFRAAIVMLGLAVEDAGNAVCDALGPYARPGSSLPWSKVSNPDTRFAARWSAARSVIGELQKVLRSAHVKGSAQPDWWGLWDYIDQNIVATVNSIREARNSAAHEPARIFESGEVSMHLAAAPHLVATLGRLRGFLTIPPVVIPPV